MRISTSGECDKKDYVWETLQSEVLALRFFFSVNREVLKITELKLKIIGGSQAGILSILDMMAACTKRVVTIKELALLFNSPGVWLPSS